MPNLLGALTDGKITADIAHKAASKAGSLEPEECRELDRLLGERLPDLDGAGTRRWGQEISAAIQGLDPDGAVGRHQRARREQIGRASCRERGGVRALGGAELM